jgi:hypothetical protein
MMNFAFREAHRLTTAFQTPVIPEVDSATKGPDIALKNGVATQTAKTENDGRIQIVRALTPIQVFSRNLHARRRSPCRMV